MDRHIARMNKTKKCKNKTCQIEFFRICQKEKNEKNKDKKDESFANIASSKTIVGARFNESILLIITGTVARSHKSTQRRRCCQALRRNHHRNSHTEEVFLRCLAT